MVSPVLDMYITYILLHYKVCVGHEIFGESQFSKS